MPQVLLRDLQRRTPPEPLLLLLFFILHTSAFILHPPLSLFAPLPCPPYPRDGGPLGTFATSPFHPSYFILYPPYPFTQVLGITNDVADSDPAYKIPANMKTARRAPAD